MRILSTGLVLGSLIALGACANNPNRPTDVGNMALPTTGTAGVRAAEPAGRDVGSMQAPSGSGGALSTTAPTSRGPADTGNMALPSRAQGNSAPTRY